MRHRRLPRDDLRERGALRRGDEARLLRLLQVSCFFRRTLGVHYDERRVCETTRIHFHRFGPGAAHGAEQAAA